MKTMLVGVIFFGITASAQNQMSGTKARANATALPVHSDLSKPLAIVQREFPLKPESGVHRIQDHPVLKLPPLKRLGPEPLTDTVLQQTPLEISVPSPMIFNGIGYQNYRILAVPPDTNGAPGTKHYVEWVNTAYAIFDKATGSMTGPFDGNALWKGFGGPCETSNDGDPIVLFDKLAGRWLFSQFSITSGQGYFQCIAVSATDDPGSQYARYSYKFDAMNDYPKFGIWPDGYYATFNMFKDGATFVGAKACAFERDKMLHGSPQARMKCFDVDDGGLLPSDFDGKPAQAPPSHSPNYFVNFGVDRLNMWKFQVDWVNPDNSTFDGPILIQGVAPFSEAVDEIPQQGTLQRLEGLGDRLMYRLVYRNSPNGELLLANHSVRVNANNSSLSSTGVRWYEIHDPGTSPTIYQQGTYAPDSASRWMGSIAMDNSGSIALGYSISSSQMYPSIRVAGRRQTDPKNRLGSETAVKNGLGFDTVYRWGDYSNMVLDPDDCTFWFTSEYLEQNGSYWSTAIAKFQYPECK